MQAEKTSLAIKLYGYFRSSASYRVRIALNLKKLPYSTQAIHLIHDGGQQFSTDYKLKNPQSLVPALEIEGKIITQSLAIIEYINEKFPQSALLPGDAFGRARVRSLSQIIACDIHPINNLRVLNYLKSSFDCNEDQKMQWYWHWIETGFSAFEQLLSQQAETGEFCHGDQPTLADICLVPQVYNAVRFGFSLKAFPIIQRINATCLKLPAFDLAHPNNQSDAE